MKKIFLTTTILLISLMAYSQYPCFIKYTYDNSGNRIKREFVCEPEDDGGGGSNNKMAQQNTIKSASEFTFQVTPNPSDGIYKLEFSLLPVNYSLMVVDNNGRTVYTKQVITQSDEIDITSLVAGTYFILVSDGKNKKMQTITKR